MLTRESIASDSLVEYHRQVQIVNRYIIAELVQSANVVYALRRELRRVFGGVKVTELELKTILATDVIKRDALEGDQSKAAKSVLRRAINALEKKSSLQAADMNMGLSPPGSVPTQAE
jgi:hypothetical protein